MSLISIDTADGAPGRALRFGAVGGLTKRAFDVLVAGCALVVLSPLLLVLWMATTVSSGGSGLYRHRRIGLGGKTFDCLKFRSMRVDGDAVLTAHLAASPVARAEWDATHKLKDDPRVTPVGRFLRCTSLDELPQLINVLRGEMSLVGPRPIVTAEIERYGDSFAAYCRARPGITGAWQVSGRSDTTYDQRVALDRAYVAEWSFVRDIGLIFKTIPAVLGSRGAY